MNKIRRIQLGYIISDLDEMEIAEMTEAVSQSIKECTERVQDLLEAEEEALENIPDNLRDYDRAALLEENIDMFYDAVGLLEEAEEAEDAESAMSLIQEAIGTLEGIE